MQLIVILNLNINKHFKLLYYTFKLLYTTNLTEIK